MVSDSEIRLAVALLDPVVRSMVIEQLRYIPKIQIVADVAEMDTLLKSIRDQAPTVLLLDLELLGPAKSELDGLIADFLPQTTTLVFSRFLSDPKLARILDTGAMGVITPETIADGFRASLEKAVRKISLFTDEQRARVVFWKEAVGERWNGLSKREREVLAWMAQGASNQTIADVMEISLNTIRSHTFRIFNKLGVKSRAEAIVFVLQLGLTDY